MAQYRLCHNVNNHAGIIFKSIDIQTIFKPSNCKFIIEFASSYCTSIIPGVLYGNRQNSSCVLYVVLILCVCIESKRTQTAIILGTRELHRWTNLKRVKMQIQHWWWAREIASSIKTFATAYIQQTSQYLSIIGNNPNTLLMCSLSDAHIHHTIKTESSRTIKS